MDDDKLEQIIQRLDKIEEMLRHMHEHMERMEEYGFINRESFIEMFRIIGDNLQDVLDKKIGGEELAKKICDLQIRLRKTSEYSYSPIDAKDKQGLEDHLKKKKDQNGILE